MRRISALLLFLPYHLLGSNAHEQLASTWHLHQTNLLAKPQMCTGLLGVYNPDLARRRTRDHYLILMIFKDVIEKKWDFLMLNSWKLRWGMAAVIHLTRELFWVRENLTMEWNVACASPIETVSGAKVGNRWMKSLLIPDVQGRGANQYQNSNQNMNLQHYVMPSCETVVHFTRLNTSGSVKNAFIYM